MSTQPLRPQEIGLTNMTQDTRPSLALVKDGNLLGRNVALISLDNPNDLNPEIEKNKSTINREFTKESLRHRAVAIAAIFLIVLCIAGLIFGSGIILPLAAGILGGVCVLWSISLMLIATISAEARQGPRRANRELEECKETMTKNKLKLKQFAFGRDDLPLDQLLKAHRLFKKAESMDHSKEHFREREALLQQDINELRREILDVIRV